MPLRFLKLLFFVSYVLYAGRARHLPLDQAGARPERRPEPERAVRPTGPTLSARRQPPPSPGGTPRRAPCSRANWPKLAAARESRITAGGRRPGERGGDRRGEVAGVAGSRWRPPVPLRRLLDGDPDPRPVGGEGDHKVGSSRAARRRRAARSRCPGRRRRPQGDRPSLGTRPGRPSTTRVREEAVVDEGDPAARPDLAETAAEGPNPRPPEERSLVLGAGTPRAARTTGRRTR